MKPGTRVWLALLFSVSVSVECWGQHPDQQDKDVCSKSSISNADCANLALEFYTNKYATTTGLKQSLLDPASVLTPFVVAQRKEAIARVLALDLKNGATAKIKIQSALTGTGGKSLIAAALNSSAQTLSTKADVNQAGATDNSTASTSLVTKPTTTDLISLAAESGAFTDTVNGNTLTAQANVDGLRRYISGIPFADLTPTAADVLQHINLTATFTVAQSGDTGVATSGSATSSTPSIASVILPSNNVSFNSLSASFSLYRKYDPRSKSFLSAWQAALKENASEIATGVGAVELADQKITAARLKAIANPAVVAAQAAWVANAKSDETQNDFAKFVADYVAYCTVFVTALRAADPQNYDSNLLSINTALDSLKEVNDAVLDKARGTPLLSLVYTYSTPPNKPATHEATLSAAYVWKGGTQFTGNAAGSWFASIPTGANYGRVQSYQFSGELDQPLGPATTRKTAPRATVSFAGYGQYQNSPTVLNITSGNLAPGTNIALPSDAQVLLGTAGRLGVAQAKLTFNASNGLTIPVAFKWSNKTDLLQGSDWKGQFGISYDLSNLPAMLKGL